MKSISLFLFVFCWTTLKPFAQNLPEEIRRSAYDDYSKFREMMRDEVLYEKENRSSSVDFGFIHPEVLPQWIEKNFKVEDDSIWLVGVSDPAMDQEKGLIVARQRVLLLYSFMNPVVASNLRDYYSNDRGYTIEEVYQEVTSWNSRFNFNSKNLEIRESHLTQYGEVIVLCRLPLKSQMEAHTSDSRWLLHSYLYTQSKKIGIRQSIDEILEIETIVLSDSILKLDFNYLKNDNVVNSSVFLNDHMISDLPAMNLRYRIQGRQSNTIPNETLLTPAYMGSQLNNGLWHALSQGMIVRLVDELNSGAIHFRQVSDHYNSNNRWLNRETVRGDTIKLQPPIFSIENNRVYLSF